MTRDPRPRKRSSPESKLQMVVCEHLRLRGVDGLLYFAPCNEGRRSPLNAYYLKRMGMLPGISDLVIDIPGQPLSFLELKAAGGKQSLDQTAFETYCWDTGRRYAVADNIDDALRICKAWGAFQQRARRAA